ncbi:MAG: type II toxin-antitoxin system RelE/ParE family toxin [Acidobacteriota bacterium]
MTLSVSFRALAQEDIESAISWYGEERPALALEFAESLDVVVARIRETPLQFPTVQGKIRRALLGRFPYGVFFTVAADRIHVLAVVHLHRHPDTWKRRSDSTEEAG